MSEKINQKLSKNNNIEVRKYYWKQQKDISSTQNKESGDLITHNITITTELLLI